VTSADVSPGAGEDRQRSGSRLLVAFVGTFVGLSVAMAVVVIAFLVVVLPSDGSGSIPGLVRVHQDSSTLDVAFGPFLVLGPVLGAALACPFVASVLRKMRAQQSAPRP